MKKEEEKTPERKYAIAKKYLKRYSHSSRDLYKAIIDVLPPLKVPAGTFDLDAINLAIKAGEIMDLLAEPSRTWSISIHWLYSVCNPKITNKSNISYSPIYAEYATQLPLNRFGELDNLIEEKDGSYVRIGDKLVGDSRFVGNGCEDFGSAWNDDGEVIKRDKDDHPVLDGFVETAARHIESLRELCCKNPRRDRHFAAFLIAHPRDNESNKRDGTVDHKEAHIHAVIDMPTRRSRYQMMELMGYNFDDLTETINWIGGVNKQNERITAFFGTLQGAMRNYVVTKDYIASLQYLVHQSKKARRDQKTPYAVNEVISWLPDDPGKSYSSIAGVYDDEMVADGVNAAIIRNLHSPYNRAHHTTRLVGYRVGDRVFSYQQLSKLRRLGAKGTGHMGFSKKSKKLILDQLMKWIYQGKIQVTDWKDALHAAFNDEDAAGLIADQDFIKRLTAVMDDQRESTINDINADRDMTTIFITAAQGGIGKSYLASRLCQYLEKGRTPYMTAAEDKGKTVDYWQDYQDQAAAVIDEVSPSSIEWSALKDMLDPHKIPRVSSRFYNTSPWNLNLLVMTNVYADGVAGYVRDVLHYAPGVTKLGYLEQDGFDKRSWKLKTKDSQAGQIYLSQLSQLLRRLPINIHIMSTDDGKGTEVVVSVINFRPGGRTIQNYDYVYTHESDHIFNVVINEDLSDQDMERIVTTVAKMIEKLRAKVKVIFQRDPNAILNSTNGFLEQHANFGYFLQEGKPYLLEPDQQEDYQEMFDNTEASLPVDNMLTRLNKLRYELWPEFIGKDVDFDPKANQFTALMDGCKVPVRRGDGDEWIVAKLSDKSMQLLKNHQATTVVMHLNEITSIEDNDDYFVLSRSKKVSRILKK